MSFYSDTIRARPGLVTYYRLNELSGTQVADSSGNSNPPATLSGSFTLGQPCVIAGESAISFDGLTGTLTLPGALNIGNWSAASVEFWIQQTGAWQQVVITMSNTGGTLLYLNGAPYSSGAGDPVLVDIDLLYAGSPLSGSLSSVSLYSVVLTAAEVATSYAAAFAAIRASDTFVRANTATSGFLWGSASDGQIWRQPLGSANAIITGNKGRVTGISTGFNAFFLGTKLFYSLDLQVNVTKSSVADVAGLLGRAKDANNYFYASFTSGSLSIFKVVGGNAAVQLGSSQSFSESAATRYTLRFLIWGFPTNGRANLFAKVWPTGTSEPTSWGVTTSDANANNPQGVLSRFPGQFGLCAALSSTGDTIDFDTFTASDPASGLNPPYNTGADLVFGSTKFVASNSGPVDPLLIAETAAWNNGCWLRPDVMWQDIEVQRGIYCWDILDDVVAQANASGVRICWCLSSAPTFRQTRDGYGANIKLNQVVASGVPLTALTVTPLNNSAHIPHQGQLTIDYGGAHPENVYVWHPAGTYTQGVTTLGISSAKNTQVAWTPAFAHAVNAQIYEATGGPVLASPGDTATFAQLAAQRYNGDGTNGRIETIQIGNEEFDGGDVRIGTAIDNGGGILAPTLIACLSAIKSVYPDCLVGAGSVRKVANGGYAHVVTWMNGLFAGLGGTTPPDWADFHYYRDGTTDWNGTLVQDPARPTYLANPAVGGTGTNNVNCPSISQEIAAIQAAAAAYGYTGVIPWCTEFGWDLYDDGSGTLLTTTPAAAATYTQHMYDAFASVPTGHCFIYTIVTTSTVNASNTPQTAVSTKSIVQIIGGVFTELAPYILIKALAQAAGGGSGGGPPPPPPPTIIGSPSVQSRVGLFGIGTYQSISGGTTVGAGWPPVTQGYVLGNPYDGVYGGTYGWVLDTRIRAPKQLIVTPAPTIGLDNTGLPVVRGYPSQTWAYSTLRPDYWYYLMNVYNQAARQPPGFQFLVLIQYPSQDGTNTLVQVLARMDPPTHGFRSVGAFWSPTLRFTYVGQAALTPGVPIVVLS